MTHIPRTFAVAMALPVALAASSCQKSSTAAAPASSQAQAAKAPATASSALGSVDSELRQAVLNELRTDKHLDSSGIQVGATNGNVQLTGKVDNLLSKERATRIAEVVRWVKSVDNRLDVAPLARSDADIARDIGNVLRADAATEKLPVHVKVNNGAATLTGVVSSPQSAELAARVADSVRGLRSMQNELTTKPAAKRTASAILTEVKNRLAWDALLDRDKLDVDLQNGRLTLSGTAGSAAEKSRAMADCWVSGVTAVEAKAVQVSWVEHPAQAVHAALKADPEIAQAIKLAASYEPRVAAFNISPAVVGGNVTLSGSVTTLQAKRAAEVLAREVVGVTRVNNELVVHPAQAIADAPLEAKISAALVCDPLTDGKGIQLAVKDGQVKLTGSVATFFESAEALDVASRVAGVTQVTDSLSVRDQSKPYVYSAWVDPFSPYVDKGYVSGVRAAQSDSMIEQRIHSEFAWSPFILPLDVQVHVKNGKATLTGTVGDYRERQAAIDEARESGAVAVDDELKLG